MRNITINKLPDSLEAILPDLMDKQRLRTSALSTLMRYVDNNCAALYTLNIETPWNGYHQFRLIVTVGHPGGVLILKNTEGQYAAAHIEGHDHERVLEAFAQVTTGKRLTNNTLLVDKKSWDSLALYHQNQGLQAFYDQHNKVTANVLWEHIMMRTHTLPRITIIDLGCGTGNLAVAFSTLSFITTLDIHWIGVDLSADNIALAESKKQLLKYPATWIQADAVQFAEHPDQYLEGSVLQRFQTDPLYLAGSGILNDGVLTMGDSVRIMHGLKQLPQLQSISLTGISRPHITPYIAKQMGFTSTLLPAHKNVTISIYQFTVMDSTEHKKRLIEKSKKHHILDLSYLSDLSVVGELSETDLNGIHYILLTGVHLSSTHMALLNHWLDISPTLLIICSPIDRPAPEIYPTLCTSMHRWRFITTDGLYNVNPFSPHFFDQMERDREAGLPMHHYKVQYKRILMKRLFIALNEDRTPPNDEVTIAKNDIHKILCGVNIYTEGVMTTDAFLATMEKSGISGKLFEALEHYVRLIHIPSFSDQEVNYLDESYTFPLQKTIHADASQRALDVTESLRNEGVLNQHEYDSVVGNIRYAQSKRHST